MNISLTANASRASWLVGSAAIFLSGSLHAAPFVYAPGDLTLAFRQSGNPTEYVVNIGRATNYNALQPGTVLPIANLSSSQLGAAFPTLNALQWSVAAANRPPVDPNYPLQTIWVTAPRQDPSLPSLPWLRKGGFVQGTAASQIDAVGVNAAASSSSQPGGINNTTTGVLIPVSSNFSIGPILGDRANYVGTFQGQVENVTAEDFDADPGNVSRSDLYELIPGTSADSTLNTPGRYLGYFEFKPDGTLTFVTPSPAVPSPVISSIVRDGETTSVTFTTIPGAQYALWFTDGAELSSPINTWTKGSSLVGDGTQKTLQDLSSDPIRFYVVEALP